MSYAKSFLLCAVLLAISPESKAQGIAYQCVPPIAFFAQDRTIQGSCCGEQCCGSPFDPMPCQPMQVQCRSCVELTGGECSHSVTETGLKEPCDIVTEHPEYGPLGGTLRKFVFPTPKRGQGDQANTVHFDEFNVEVENLCGRPSDYALVTGALKTAVTSLQSEFQLQVDTLSSKNEPVRITPKTLQDVDADGTLRLFVMLIHTPTHRTIRKEYSSEWRAEDIKGSGTESNRDTTHKLVIHLPY